jgi:hypothetical protein
MHSTEEKALVEEGDGAQGEIDSWKSRREIGKPHLSGTKMFLSIFGVVC